MDYVEKGAAQYQQQFVQREVKIFKKLALKYNCDISALQEVT
jgi:hypothetical protein